jgi:HAE1 family hydrophobic/amphiphilic exporter-1
MNIAQISINRPVFIVMIVLSIIVLGIVGYSNLAVDLLPKVESPSLMVFTVYPGASAEEIEDTITKPLENSLGTVEGLDTLSSISREGLSRINVNFNIGVDVKYAELKVREKVQIVMPLLPTDAQEPVVRKFSTEDIPIMYMSVVGKKDLTALSEIIEDTIQPRIETIEGVGSISITGARKRILQIECDTALLQANGLTYNQIVAAISRKNVSFPVGTIRGNKKNIAIRVTGKAESIEEIANMNFMSTTGRIVRIGDVAKVNMSIEDEQSRARVNNKNAVMFYIFKQSGANTVKVAALVRKALTKLKTDLPSGVSVEIVSDTSETIDRSIRGVQEDILTGALLAIIIVWLFLGNFRSTIITAAVLPNSILGAFFLVFLFGFSLNTMTLLALSLCVGLLIDDSIVVRENIFRYIENGLDPKQAAIKGTNEVGLAVLSTTLAILAVFIPISFLQGMVGQFFREFGLTVAFALIISLIDAFTTAPMLSAYWYAPVNKAKQKGIVRLFSVLSSGWNRFYDRINRYYHKLLEWGLNHKRVVIIATIVLFSLSLYVSGFIGKSFMSTGDSGGFAVNVELYPGASLDETDKYLKQIETFLLGKKSIDSFYSIVGDDSSNSGTVNVSLVALRDRKESTQDIIGATRKFIDDNFDRYIRYRITEKSFMGGMGLNYAIQIDVSGKELPTLESVSKKVMTALSETTGATDVNMSFKPGAPELVLKLDELKAEKLGITAGELALLLRDLVAGSKISTYNLSGRDYDVVIRLKETSRNEIQDFRNLIITTRTGKKVPLSSICEFKLQSAPLEIRRENKNRVIRINANLANGYSLSDVIESAKKNIDKTARPQGYNYEFTGQQKQFVDLITQISFAVLLAIIFMYMILASLYNSAIQPLILMLSIPLAIIGAFLGLLVTGVDLDVYGYIGILLVLGLVAKNAILLIDFTNKNRAEGKSIRDALLIAGPIRLRPILMTTFAMIFGMLPLALGLNEGSTGRQSMPIAVIGGLLTSTFLTLIVVPVVYELVESKLEKRRARKKAEKEALKGSA